MFCKKAVSDRLFLTVLVFEFIIRRFLGTFQAVAISIFPIFLWSHAFSRF